MHGGKVELTPKSIAYMCAAIKLPASTIPLYINSQTASEHEKGTNAPAIAVLVSLANVAPKGKEATLEQQTETLQIAPKIIADHPMLSGTISSDIKVNVMVSKLVRAHEHLVGAEVTVPSRPSIKKRKADEEHDCSIGFGPASKSQRSFLHYDGDFPEVETKPAQQRASAKPWCHLLK